MREREADFESAGASLGAVGLGDERYARAFRDETGIGFPLLIDEERRAYRAASLRRASILSAFRSENVAARRRAKDAGHRHHRPGRNPLQLGGSFVFAPGDVDVFSHVSRTFGDNVPVDDLLAAARRV